MYQTRSLICRPLNRVPAQRSRPLERRVRPAIPADRRLGQRESTLMLCPAAMAASKKVSRSLRTSSAVGPKGARSMTSWFAPRSCWIAAGMSASSHSPSFQRSPTLYSSARHVQPAGDGATLP